MTQKHKTTPLHTITKTQNTIERRKKKKANDRKERFFERREKKVVIKRQQNTNRLYVCNVITIAKLYYTNNLNNNIRKNK